MHGMIEKFLAWPPPAWVRKVEAAVIMGVFAEAFDVEPPSCEGLSADEALYAFREFTAACMEEALEDEQAAAIYRARLRASGMKLGMQLRETLHVQAGSAFPLAQFIYRGIGIELTSDESGVLRFGPCSFSELYSPQCCWFMSAFDEGFLCGLMGIDASLVFACRLTEGAPCCQARFE